MVTMSTDVPVELDTYTPDQGTRATWNPFGDRIEGTTPSTRKQLDSVRRFGISQCEDLNCDAVAVTVNWLHQFPTRVVVDKYGFVRDDGNTALDYDEFVREAEEITK